MMMRLVCSSLLVLADQLDEIPDHRHVVADQGRHFVQIDDPEFVSREVLALLEGLNDERD